MIRATIIQDSISEDGVRLTTFELEYPRFIHAELMTHRMFSRNAASSRAVPIEKMIEHVRSTPAKPIFWGKNQPGMQAAVELEGNELQQARSLWDRAATAAAGYSSQMAQAGMHKQIANRVTEPYQTMKTIITATEFANWYWLRDHHMAQPEIARLAAEMFEAHLVSEPLQLSPGQWHVPYVERQKNLVTDKIMYLDSYGYLLSVEDAKMISASCCAQVSYRKSDDTLEKAKMIYDRLINTNGDPVHASPVEHQATPMKYKLMDYDYLPVEWEKGVTHLSANGDFWSGNFRGWIQQRQLIEGNAKW